MGKLYGAWYIHAVIDGIRFIIDCVIRSDLRNADVCATAYLLLLLNCMCSNCRVVGANWRQVSDIFFSTGLTPCFLNLCYFPLRQHYKINLM